MEKWFVAMKKADFDGIAQKYNISPIVARLIRNRDILCEEDINFYLNGTIGELHDGMLMKDMDKAVEILAEKVGSKAPIRVIGDYDIDGVNAAHVLWEGLRKLGAQVDTDIPERIKDGYGLNRTLIDKTIEDGIDTIITCDNGIAAVEEIAYGKQRGLTIIVTDHHQVPYVDVEGNKDYILPRADAVVNPQRPDCEYPFKGLCGTAVAYKLVEALYEVMQRDIEDIDYLMENVAIATIGDVMDLTGENRVFVKQGLEMLRCTNNLGLKALMECTKVPVDRLSAYHVGFVLGPCINAGGRLDTAKRALSLFMAESPSEAVMLAEDLKALNDSRKEMTEKGVEQAAGQIETSALKEDKVLVVYLPDCHESIAGIIAGRIKERYYKPTFVLTLSEQGVKGSGRSIEAYNMFEEMCRCRDIFTKFGGHKFAAGLSMEESDIERFRQSINDLANLSEEDLLPKVSIDMQLPLRYVTKELVQELELLEPFGKGNRKPLFAEKNLRILGARIVGKHENVLKFQVQDRQGQTMEAVYFGEAKRCLEYMSRKEEVSLTYCPAINEYMGKESLQLQVVNYQ